MEDNDTATAAPEEQRTVSSYPFVQSVPSPEGIAKLVEILREQTEGTLIPRLTLIQEPETGTQAFVIASPDGLEALPASIFDDYRKAPTFRRGTATMTQLESFIDHVNRFGDADSAVFASDDRSAPKLTAVLDYHEADGCITSVDDAAAGPHYFHGAYRHGRHRTTFAFPLSDEWKAWIASNGKVMKMGSFAKFLEDRIGDIAPAFGEMSEEVARFVTVNGGPDAIAEYAALVELSRGLKVHESNVIEEATVLASGEGHIRFSVDHTTRNGLGNAVKVPTMFFIGIPIFKNGAPYRIAARLRYRKTDEGIVFWFDLWREDRSFDHAFAEAVQRVRNETPAQIFYGSPESS